ncbi:hypothetical protein TeGR_g13040 [Tetraparma gracilis]|uniref:Uncharacterized protein n=1 Tax=Tetraparma gracilis TaxID=2962635 RepID=A0ABQ6MW52_9STRA|nr:hypothetical protein TeGR_g13040 [Tetraparma gracilis]
MTPHDVLKLCVSNLVSYLPSAASLSSVSSVSGLLSSLLSQLPAPSLPSVLLSLLLTLPPSLLLLLRFLLPPPVLPLSLDDPLSSGSHHCVVTGGSSGIGLEIAKALAGRPGVRVVTILARDGGRLESARREVEAAGRAAGRKVGESSSSSPSSSSPSSSSPSSSSPSSSSPSSPPSSAGGLLVNPVSADLCDYPALSAAASAACAAHGAPSLLFNVAGFAKAAPLLAAPMELFRSMSDTNYLGTVAATKAFLPAMLEAGGPRRVLLTSSCAGQIGLHGYSAYSASKFALRGFAEALSLELVGTGAELTVA